ncbi:MAG TPA: polyprenyl diphosphate synthase [Chroococcales cyanobacterium]
MARASSKSKESQATGTQRNGHSESERLPLSHVAIIMDGNRRWADNKHLPRLLGHKEGVKSLKRLVRHVGAQHLEYLTVYAFSSENWQRSPEEVNYLFELFQNVLIDELDSLAENEVRLSFVGHLPGVPEKLKMQMERAVERTAANQGLRLQVAINYGSRMEITDAVRQIACDYAAQKLSLSEITEELVGSYLYTRNIPDPELLIRTGGEMRLSNYLLWQAAYTELFVTPVLWPDFTPQQFDKAIAEFSSRQRRYGGD